MKLLFMLLAISVTFITRAQGDSLRAAVYNWSNASVQKKNNGESRNVLKGSTQDLSSLSIHTSTLNAGLQNHAPAAYADKEELIIVKEGNLVVTINATTKTLGPNGIVFIASGDTQSFKSTAAGPVTYYVISFKPRAEVVSGHLKQGTGSFMANWTDLEVKKTPKGASRPVFDKVTAMFKRFDVHATSLDPGFASHLPHVHRAEEMILLIEGSGEMQIGDGFHKAVNGDIVFMQANMLHAFKNTGSVPCTYFAIQWHQEGY